MLATIKTTQTLPSIVAITGMRDHGPSDGEGSANCPHCGARGRYVWSFICADGSHRGAMRGCIKLFPGSDSRYAKLAQEAFDRRDKAKEEGKNLASWWREMVDAVEEFGSQTEKLDHDGIQAATFRMQQKISAAEGRRQDWLSKNGYGKKYGRR